MMIAADIQRNSLTHPVEELRNSIGLVSMRETESRSIQIHKICIINRIIRIIEGQKMMHFMLSSMTSLLAITANILSYWQIVHQRLEYHIDLNNRWQIALLAEENSGNTTFATNKEQSILVMCTSSQFKTMDERNEYTVAIFDHFQKNELLTYFHSHLSEYSCLLYDSTALTLYLISDAVGSTPLWYHMDTFISNENIQIPIFFTSTDPFLAMEYGIYRLNSVPPNHMLVIDLSTNDLIDIVSLDLQNRRRSMKDLDLPDISNNLLSLISKSLESSLSRANFSGNDQVVMEVDEMNWISKLLDCSADLLKIPREIRKTRPLVLHDSQNRSSPEIFRKIKDLVVAKDEALQTIAPNTLVAKFYDRLHFCQRPKESTERFVYISFDTGFDDRMEDIALQNLFCSLSNVTIVYPFLDFHFQKFIRQFPRPESIMNTVMALLADTSCKNTVFSTRFISIEDILCETTTRCFDYKVMYNENQQRKLVHYTNHFSFYDKKMLREESIATTTTSSAEKLQEHQNFLLESKQRANNLLELLKLTAKRHATSEGYLIILTFSNATMSYELFNNYLCHLTLTFQSNPVLPLLVLADDYQFLSQFDYPPFAVIAPEICIFDDFTEIDRRIYSDEKLEVCRFHVIAELLKIGIHAIYSDIDTIWLKNPFPFLSTSLSTEQQQFTENLHDRLKGGLHPVPSLSLIGNDGNVYVSQSELLRKQSDISLISSDSLSKLSGASSSLLFSASSASAAAALKKKSKYFDVGFIAESNNVVRNFLIFQATERTIRYLNQFVTSFHLLLLDLVETAKQSEEKAEQSQASSSSSSARKFKKINFAGAIQRAFDYFLLEGNYDAEQISCKRLNPEYFSTAFQYYFERKTFSSAAVVINNYLPKKDHYAKYYRLLKYGQMIYLPPPQKFNSVRPMAHYHSRYCLAAHSSFAPVHNYLDNRWTDIFPFHKRYGNAFYFNVLQPYHNQILSPEDIETDPWASRVGFMMFEGNFTLKHPRDERSLIHTYMNSDALFGYQRSVVYNINFSLLKDHPLLSLVFLIPKTRFHHSVDVLLQNYSDADRSGFGVDYAYNRLDDANRQMMLLSQRFYEIQEKKTEIPFPFPDESFFNDENFDEDSFSDEKNPKTMQYHIKVIAFNRVDSLNRLLSSLRRANYGEHRNISLEILVDRFRSDQEEIDVMNVVKLGEEFDWPFGPKRVHLREDNIGLANQWYRAWNPQSLNEVAFIFEDDIEVSPYYFTWATSAVEKYYQKNKTLQKLHVSLVKAVREKIELSERDETIQINSLHNFQSFVENYLGYPLIYGICLQKQALDAQRYPKTVHLRTGNRPFLYSPIGTWGPVFFPAIWIAFREWWSWRMKLKMTNNYNYFHNNPTNELVIDEFPTSANLCQNMFMGQNPRIWSPYLVRFAYEFGAKCLYTNLPGNLTLINNHREKGENYDKTTGNYARLLDQETIDLLETQLTSQDELSYYRNPSLQRYELEHQINLLQLSKALNYFPSITELTHYQFDYNQRRIGSLGFDNPFPLIAYLKENDPEEIDRILSNSSSSPSSAMIPLYQSMNHFLQFTNSFNEYLVSSSSWSSTKSLTLLHWLELKTIVEANVLPSSKILFLEVTPLLFYFHFYAQLSHDYSYQLLLPAPAGSGTLPACRQFREKYQEFNGNLPIKLAPVDGIPCFDGSNSNEQVTGKELLHLLVLPLELLHRFSGDGNHRRWTELISNHYDLHALEYLLVIDNCVSAPDYLFIDFPAGDNQSVSLEFFAIEQLCDVKHFQDTGGVLYRLKDPLQRVDFSGEEQETWITRRLKSDLLHSFLSPMYNNAIFV